MPAGIEQVAVAIVVEIDQPDTPLDMWHRAGTRVGRRRHVFEEAVAEIAEEDRQLPLIGSLHEVEPTVVVEVPAFDAHAAQLFAAAVVSGPNL